MKNHRTGGVDAGWPLLFAVWRLNTDGSERVCCAACKKLNQARRTLTVAGFWLLCFTVFADAPPGQPIGWGDNSWSQATVPPGLSNVVSVAGGSVFSLALLSDGTVYGWGENYWGEVLGTRTTVYPAITNGFVTLSGERLRNVRSISAAGYFANAYGHCLALKADGTVAAWGAMDTVPTQATNVVAVSAGPGHNLAVLGDGTVLGWGANNYGQATGTSSSMTTGLVSLAGQVLSNVTAVSASGAFSLGLKPDGTVVLWGNGPGVPAGLAGVCAIAAGSSHCVALKSNGTVIAWGDNSYGQTNIPSDLSNVVAVAASGSEWGRHSLALKATGSVVAWGDYRGSQTNVPAGLSNVVSIVAGSEHSLAVTAALRITSFGFKGSQPALSFRSFAGQAYTVESSPDLSPGSWTEWSSGTVQGTGQEILLVDTNAVPGRRFYRLQLRP